MKQNPIQQWRHGSSRPSVITEGLKPENLQRKPTLHEDTPQFRTLRRIAHDDRPAIMRKTSSLERYPRVNSAWLKFKAVQKVLYLFLEDPTSSKLSLTLFIIVIVAIIFSTINAIISSAFGSNDTVQKIELAISILFIVEYALRLLSATAFGENFFAVIFKPLNLLDIAGILPFFLELILNSDNDQTHLNLSIIRIIRLIKIVRVLKLGRYLQGAEVFYEGVQASVGSLGFMVLLIFFVNITGGTALYYAESHPLGFDNVDPDDPERITSVFQAIFGDYTCQTLLGKIVKGCLYVIGMLLYALPVAFLGNNFQVVYNRKEEDDYIQDRKEKHFKGQQTLSDAQKEIIFMNERILSIENTNRAIIKILNDSEANYNEVSKKLKNLYESIYADEETLAKKEEEKRKQETNNSGSGFIGAKMETRIKLYEKLNRAKRKIDLAVLFKKKTEIIIPSENEGTDQTIKDENGPKSRNSLGTQIKSRTRLPTEKMDLNVSDIVETEGGAISGVIPVMASQIKRKKYDRYKISRLEYCRGELDPGAVTISKNSEIDRSRAEKRSNKTIIKSHSVDSANSFLSYYVRNLNFIPLELLAELASEDSTDPSEEEEAVEETPHFLKLPKKVAVNERRRASVSGIGSFKVNGQNPEKVKRKHEKKKTRIIDITKPGKFVPKNYDKRIWELTGKILESMEQKAKLGESKLVDDKAGGKSEEMLKVEKAIEMARNEIQRLMKVRDDLANKEFEIRAQQSLREYERQSTVKLVPPEQDKTQTPVLSPLLREKLALIHQAKTMVEESKNAKPMNTTTKNQTTDYDRDKETQKEKESRINLLESDMPHIQEEGEGSLINTGRSTLPMIKKTNEPSLHTISFPRRI